jgi:hypothetical protein
MQQVEDFVGALKARYGGQVPFGKICEEEGITVMTAPLGLESWGFYYSRGNTNLIVVNESLCRQERREWAMHLLWHHFHRYQCKLLPDEFNNDEMRGYLFAALAIARHTTCRAECPLSGGGGG